MSDDASEPFSLRRISDGEWFIVDTRYPPADPRAVIARIERQDEASVRLVWTGSVALSTEYIDAETALEDLRDRTRRRARSTRPIPIPSFAPPARHRP